MRLLIDPPSRGAWNMALDDALLDAAAEGTPTLRFYQWAPATLSLGYFQAAADRAEHVASGAASLVRRRSGGGAIVHDRELTYSLSLPGGHPLAGDAEALYWTVHQSLVKSLAAWNVPGELWEGGEPIGVENFLCFQQRSPGDVTLAGRKIGGSAQRRRKSAILLHGSVLLAASDAAPELPGIAELAGVSIKADQLIEAWRPSWEALLGVRLEPGGTTARELAAAERIEREVFANDAWTFKR